MIRDIELYDLDNGDAVNKKRKRGPGKSSTALPPTFKTKTDCYIGDAQQLLTTFRAIIDHCSSVCEGSVMFRSDEFKNKGLALKVKMRCFEGSVHV